MALDARIDPCGGDPTALELRRRLDTGDWAHAQRLLAATRDWDLRSFYVSVAAADKARPDWLDAWCAARPGSALPCLVRGAHGVGWAWQARGAGTAQTVSPEGWADFHARLEAAESDLRRAAELDPEDPTPWAYLVSSGMGLQLEEAEETRRFEEARARFRWHRSAHERRLSALCWKWGGSHEAMFAFARTAAAAAPEGSLLHGLLASAHYERWMAFGMEGETARRGIYLRESEVVAEVRQAWIRSTGSPRYRARAGSAGVHGLFGFLFWRQRARAEAWREIQATRGVIATSPWGTLGEPAVVFAQAVRETQDEPSSEPAIAARVRDVLATGREVARDSGVLLDDTEASLPPVDKMLVTVGRSLRGGSDRESRTLLGASYSFGAYLGELVRRKLGGEWVAHEGYPFPVLKWGEHRFTPTAAVVRRMTVDDAPSLPQVFADHVRAQLDATPPPPPEPYQALVELPDGADPIPLESESLQLIDGAARRAVELAASLLHETLDFSPRSLSVLDALFTQMQMVTSTGSTPDLAGRAIMQAGTYLGETVRRELGGRWVHGVPGIPKGVFGIQVDRRCLLPLGAALDLARGGKVRVGSREVDSAEAFWNAAVMVGGPAPPASDPALAASIADDPRLGLSILGWAEAAVQTARLKWGRPLDYTEATLDALEEILDVLHRAVTEPLPEGETAVTDEQLKGAVVTWGAYVGEVLRRALGGRWTNTPVRDQGPVIRLVIGEAEVYPMGKVQKRLRDGRGDAIPFYVRATRHVLTRGGDGLGVTSTPER